MACIERHAPQRVRLNGARDMLRFWGQSNIARRLVGASIAALLAAAPVLSEAQDNPPATPAPAVRTPRQRPRAPPDAVAEPRPPRSRRRRRHPRLPPLPSRRRRRLRPRPRRRRRRRSPARNCGTCWRRSRFTLTACSRRSCQRALIRCRSCSCSACSTATRRISRRTTIRKSTARNGIRR